MKVLTMKYFILFSLLTVVFPFETARAQVNKMTEFARIKYRGGSDWYNDPSALRNLIKYVNLNFSGQFELDYRDVSIGSKELFEYPFAFMTGHGDILINDEEIENLRAYLENGGFLYIDDDYGLDKSTRAMIKRLFPDEELLELPKNHLIYRVPYAFPDGLIKVHEHDNKPPQGFAIYKEGKMVLYYTYESNLSDGWTDPEVHNNPKSLRENALKMGANILVFALSQIK